MSVANGSNWLARGLSGINWKSQDCESLVRWVAGTVPWPEVFRLEFKLPSGATAVMSRSADTTVEISLQGICAGDMWLGASSEYRANISLKFRPVWSPPKWGEIVLLFLLPRNKRHETIGDLAEDFSSWVVPKYGTNIARWLYWREVARTVPWLWLVAAWRLLR
jgi:hypothetical protein